MTDMYVKEELLSFFGEEKLSFDEAMSLHTSFRVGGPADFFVTVYTLEDIVNCIDFCRDKQIPLYTLGCGSNVLVSDEGLRGLVMRIGPKFSHFELKGNSIVAQAGATNAKIAKAAQLAGLSGYEFAAGIPGSLGGAAIMNAGAYDGEFSQVAVQVKTLSPQGDIQTLSASEAQWTYRGSFMKEAGYIVLEVTLDLKPGDPKEIKAYMNDLSQKRNLKQPLDLPSAGSSFKRPEGYFAGKLIQDAGLQGYTIGGAQVSRKHAGFIVNANKASAQDIYKLLLYVQNEVQNKFGVCLQPEVCMWGFN